MVNKIIKADKSGMTHIKEYDNMVHMINMIIMGDVHGCIITSEGGLGKSFLVRTMLEQSGREFFVTAGHVTPLALYALMHKNKKAIILLDDVEDVLKNDVSVGVLKAALWDVKGDGKRRITWASTSKALAKLGIPMQFDFEGAVILLCNKVPRSSDEVLKALKTRGFELTINLSYSQKLKICTDMVNNQYFYKLSGVKLTKKQKEIITNTLTKETSVLMESFNFRTLIKLIKFYKYNVTYHKDDKDLYLRLLKTTIDIDKDKEIIYTLMQNSGLSIKEQVQIFCEESGKSRATYFRLKKMLES